MSREPLVSIVLPVYNGAKFLGESIESCLRQTYRNIEIIVVDDGSTDDSVDIVNSFKDFRIKLFCHEINRKLSASLNTGFARSSGEYLTWTSDDNYYASSAIAEMVSFLEEYLDIDFLFSNQYDVDESGQIIGEVIPGPFEKLPEWCCASGGFLYRRSVYNKLGGYDERLPLAQDYDYWLRAYEKFALGHLDRFLYYNRVHPRQMTNRFSAELIAETLIVKRKIFGKHFIKNRLRLQRDHLYAAAQLFHEKYDRAAAARATLWAIAFDPRCLVRYDVLALLAGVCFGAGTLHLLRRAKHTILPASSESQKT